MFFPNKFVRYVGTPPAGGIALGADVDPTTLTAAQQLTYKTLTNVLTSRLANTIGFPVQRVAVGCTYTGTGAPSAIPIVSHVWDDNTQRWFTLQQAAAISVAVNSITFVDVPSLLDFPTTDGNGLRAVGALELAIVAAVPTTHPDGTYTFVTGCDVSNPGV